MNLGQKLQVAKALRDLGVDVIEAGFAAASPGDLESIREVGRQVEGPVVCSLARSSRGDIEGAWSALDDAPRRRMHGVLAGARQVECTINGIGEREGNAPLEEVVMAMKPRQDVLQVQTDVHTER